jgi:hypothetical protein
MAIFLHINVDIAVTFAAFSSVVVVLEELPVLVYFVPISSVDKEYHR